MVVAYQQLDANPPPSKKSDTPVQARGVQSMYPEKRFAIPTLRTCRELSVVDKQRDTHLYAIKRDKSRAVCPPLLLFESPSSVSAPRSSSTNREKSLCG